MNSKSNFIKTLISLTGFVFLFLIYHLPEILQNHFQKPLLLFFELGMLVFIVIAFYFGKRWHRNGFRIYGLFSFGQQWGNLVKGLLIGVAIAALANLIPVWLGWNQISIHFNWFQIISQTLLFAFGTLLPSLAEDILTRGYLLAYWPKRWKLHWLILISATVYVLNHIFRLGKPDVMLYLFILGLLLIYALVKTGTLWLTLGIHWGSNIVYQIFSNLVSSNPIKETGLENYVLAGSYLIGFVLIYLLTRFHFFSQININSGRRNP